MACAQMSGAQRLQRQPSVCQAHGAAVTQQCASRQTKRQARDGPACTGPSLQRSSVLRVALLAAAGSLPLLRPLPATADALADLPPLQPVRGTVNGPYSKLLLDPQLLPMQPGPTSFPRRQVDLNFAVLLMRNGYQAVDDLDFVAMDEFQKRFWKLRQAEWEPYLLLHSPLRIQQGQLSDPLYLDFITYSQAAAASNLMKQGKQVFEEYEEESEGKRVVTRDPSLADNAQLPGRFYERHGELVYRGLVEGFRGEQYGGPLPCAPGASTEQLMAGVQQVLDIFAAKGFSLKTTLLPKPASGGSGDGFTVVQQGPANLWSLQALAARRSLVYQQPDAAAVAAFLRASGRSSTCRLTWTDTAVTQEWNLV
ncbi:hypothetical protein D9Q98_007235 [Chlorella vulgaris]|uniref:Uncharacterized protein n=1 Tax=Chlorella vulgaris TaxID=3077 RepID=A0A9D4TKX6_CHLVU|nr:hypothetical protein D9Q98_007235 [Chlorella vulgaris]